LQALARALYSRKESVLLDDIFSGMDAHTVNLVSQRLLGAHGLFCQNGSTVILAKHNRESLSPQKIGALRS
jgi:ABC-type nitrate/sulfonate/bicarbonate transport system ATPase subunit